MLRYMHDEKYQLTPNNYLNYLEEERQFYKNYDYTLLTNQEDYLNDYYAAAFLNKEITGIEPYRIFENTNTIELSNATIEEDQYNGQNGLVCTGSLSRPSGSEISVSEFLKDYEYIGAKIQLADVSPYKYLVFYGKKTTNHGQLTVRLYDANGEEIAACDENYHNLDEEWHQYMIDIGNAQGPCTLILNGGYIDSTGSADSKYVFSDVTLY